MSAVTGLRSRMISPDLLLADDLEPGVRRLLFAGLMMSAEDSGCLPMPTARGLRATIVPYADVTPEQVGEHVEALIEGGRVVPYEVAGRPYAFLPDFPRWNALTRWNEPRMAPLPSWITFAPDSNNANRRGAGTYTWGSPNANGFVELSECKKDNEPTNQLTNEPASSLGAGCEQAAESIEEEESASWRTFLGAYPKTPAGNARGLFDALPPELRARAYLAAEQRVVEAEAAGTDLQYMPSVTTLLADPVVLDVLATRREQAISVEVERQDGGHRVSKLHHTPPDLSPEQWERNREQAKQLGADLRGRKSFEAGTS